MDSLSSSNLSAFSSNDPKTVLMQQIRTSIAVENARQLVEVRTRIWIRWTSSPRYLFRSTPLSYAFSNHFQETLARRLLMLSFANLFFLFLLSETQWALLRTLRAKTRLVFVARRGDMLQELHGEVHGRMEHRQQAVCRPYPERGTRARRRRVKLLKKRKYKREQIFWENWELRLQLGLRVLIGRAKFPTKLVKLVAYRNKDLAGALWSFSQHTSFAETFWIWGVIVYCSCTISRNYGF